MSGVDNMNATVNIDKAGKPRQLNEIAAYDCFGPRCYPQGVETPQTYRVEWPDGPE